VNDVAVNTLFGFLDFAQFKKQALKMKEGDYEYTSEQLQESKGTLPKTD